MIRIAITGCGTVSPFGAGVERFITGICSGETAIRPIAFFCTDDLPAKLSADVRDTGFRKLLGGALARRLDPASIMTLIAAREAIKSSGLDIVQSPDKIGIVIGTRSAGFGVSIDFLEAIAANGVEHASPMLFMNTVLNAPASYLAIDQKIRGPNFTVTRGILSSTQALYNAIELIRSKRASAVVTGGVDWIHPMAFEIMARLNEFSTRGKYSEGCRPFSTTANGPVASEGASMLVIEDMDSVLQRGGKVLAEITGTCTGAITQNYPESFRAMIHQMQSGPESEPADIDGVLSGAEGTPETDQSELAGLKALVQDSDPMAVAAIRASIGSCCVSGCSQIIAAIHSLSENILPATPGDGAWQNGDLRLSRKSQQLQSPETILVTDFDPEVITATLISKPTSR